MTPEQLDSWFGRHVCDEKGQANMENVRRIAKIFANCIVANCPAGADASAAVRKVREAMMTANAAISEKYPLEAVAKPRFKSPDLDDALVVATYAPEYEACEWGEAQREFPDSDSRWGLRCSSSGYWEMYYWNGMSHTARYIWLRKKS